MRHDRFASAVRHGVAQIAHDGRRTVTTVVSGDFDLSFSELRVVTGFVVEAAEAVLDRYEAACPTDPRPAAALEAARAFAAGGPRGSRLRVASLAAHRAAWDATDEVLRLAAQSAGDAASAAYLHPIRKVHQVAHILRADANVARIAEIDAGGDASVAPREIEASSLRAGPTLRAVLCRYPPVRPGRARVSRLMADLDEALRSRHRKLDGQTDE